tara:strand:- start:176 stop:1966 length:1791 start_codon:yes stop_codon:yes gene_type:complete
MLEQIIGTAAKGGLSVLATKIVKSSGGAMRQKIERILSERNLNTFRERSQRVGYVKTILNPDSIEPLDRIFFESATLCDGEKIETFTQFSRKHVLVEGGPGQGKSLLLRRACINESESSSYIPIFIEFRNLAYSKPLKVEIIDAINELGVPIDASVFDYVALSGRIILFLDGFDEIPNDKKNKAARDLEALARTFPDLRLVVSSRPNAGMGGTIYFSKVKLDPMTLKVQTEFIENLYKNRTESENLKNLLLTSPFLSEVTTSPLLLTLFFITYNARQFKPDSLSEFYSLIFPTMLYRHDRMKVGFERQRRSGLTDYQMQKVFDSLSFLSLNENNTRFSAGQFRQYLESASKLERLDDNLEDDLMCDISSITALIVSDGFDYYSYTHKSIQEYFSAVFIQRLNEERKKSFYSKVVLDINEFRKWQNVLNFLGTIDERNYTKYFLIPYKRSVLSLNDKNQISISFSSLSRLIGINTKLLVDEDGNLINTFWEDTLINSLYPQYAEYAQKSLNSFIASISHDIAEMLSYCNESDYEKFQTLDNYFAVQLEFLIGYLDNKKKLCDFMSERFEQTHFKRDVLKLESELIHSDDTMNEILPF